MDQAEYRPPGMGYQWSTIRGDWEERSDCLQKVSISVTIGGKILEADMGIPV
jgi:hypothetical protein